MSEGEREREREGCEVLGAEWGNSESRLGSRRLRRRDINHERNAIERYKIEI